MFVADARQLRLISQSCSKNDRNNAYWLAELGRTNPALLAPVEPLGQQARQHRSWLRGRETLLGARTQLLNSVRGIAKSHGIRFGPCGMTKWDAAVEKKCPAVLPTILKPMARIIAALTREINKLDRRLEKRGKRAVSGHAVAAHGRRSGPADEPGLRAGVEQRRGTGEALAANESGGGLPAQAAGFGRVVAGVGRHQGGESDAAAAGAVLTKDIRTFLSGIGFAELGLAVGGAGQEAGQAAVGIESGNQAKASPKPSPNPCP